MKLFKRRYQKGDLVYLRKSGLSKELTIANIVTMDISEASELKTKPFPEDVVKFSKRHPYLVFQFYDKQAYQMFNKLHDSNFFPENLDFIIINTEDFQKLFMPAGYGKGSIFYQNKDPKFIFKFNRIVIPTNTMNNRRSFREDGKLKVELVLEETGKPTIYDYSVFIQNFTLKI